MGYSRVVTSSTLDAEPACPGAADTARPLADPAGEPSRGHTSHHLIAVRRPFESIDRETWDALAAANPWATPFSKWAFHRAWWDAYGATSHEETIVVVDAADPSGPPVAIVPLMHRHEVEPADEAARTSLRHAPGGALTPVEPTAKAIFFGASYHADYATILTHPLDLPAAAEALVEHLARVADGAGGAQGATEPTSRTRPPSRRVGARCAGTSSTCAACAAATRRPMRWPPRSSVAPQPRAGTSPLEREDVCPVVTLPEGCRFRGLPRPPRQEAAPRGPAQDPARGGGRSEVRLDDRRGSGWPRSRPSSISTRSAGAPTACSRRPPVATRAGGSSSGWRHGSGPMARFDSPG